MIVEEVELLVRLTGATRADLDEGPARVREVDRARGEARDRVLELHLRVERPRVRFADRVCEVEEEVARELVGLALAARADRASRTREKNSTESDAARTRT